VPIREIRGWALVFGSLKRPAPELGLVLGLSPVQRFSALGRWVRPIRRPVYRRQSEVERSDQTDVDAAVLATRKSGSGRGVGTEPIDHG
jgi:hypothetical protein